MNTRSFRLPAYWTLSLLPSEHCKPDPLDEQEAARWHAWASHTFNLGECVGASQDALITDDHDAKACVGRCVTRMFDFAVLPADAVSEDDIAPPTWYWVVLWALAIIAVGMGLYQTRDPDCVGSVQPAKCAD